MQEMEVLISFFTFSFLETLLQCSATPSLPHQQDSISLFPVPTLSSSNPVRLLIGIQEWTSPPDTLKSPYFRTTISGPFADSMFW